MKIFRHKLMIIGFLALCSIGPALVQAHPPKGSPPSAPAGIMVAFHDANEVRLVLASSGTIGLDITSGYPVGNWPKETENNYIFGSGFWVGGIADIDGDGEEESLSVQAYGYSSQGEFAPGRMSDDPEDPLARLYASTIPQDLLEWPAEFEDESGSPLVHSLQDIVGIYNDLNGTPIYMLGPVGIQVEQRSMSFAAGRTSQVIIVIWDMTNISAELPEGPYTIEDAYVAIDSDMDIGDNFDDDRTSFFTYQVTERGDSIPVMMAFAWDENFDEYNFGGIPGFVGVKYLLSPGNDTDGTDNDRDGLVDESPYNGIDDDLDGTIDEWDEVDELGLVNYSIVHGMSAQGPRPYPDSDAAQYRVMSCDPPSECVETMQSRDTRFVMSSGPFDLPPGRTVRVAIAYVFSLPVGEPTHIDMHGDPPRPDPNDPVFADFLAVALETQGFFNTGFPDTLTELLVYSTTRHADTNDIAGPYEVFTSVASAEGVSRVALFYSLDAGNTFLTRDMDLLAGNTYHAGIEGTGRGGGEIEYFVQAVDSAFSVAREPVSAPAETFEFRIFYIPDFFPPDSVSGIAPFPPGSSYDFQWGDVDGDSDLDLYVTTAIPNNTNHLYRNDGGKSFTEVTDESGTGLPRELCREASVGDYDNDGDLDIVVATHASHLHLLRNTGEGTFDDVSPEAGLVDTVFARKPFWIDADRDGFLDLLLAGLERVFLYMNRGGTHFAEEALERGLPSGLGQVPLLPFDADGDGDSDLLLMTEASRYYRNDSGYFVDATGVSGLGIGMDAAAVADIDGDFDLDLLVAYSHAMMLFLNDGVGHFSSNTDLYNFSSVYLHSQLLTGDVNNDGFPDLFVSTGIYTAGADRIFRNTLDVNGIYAIDAICDADSDGLLDVFATGLYICSGFTGGIENNWLEVDLEGTRSNRSAIGATATLTAGEKVSSGVVPGSSPLPLRLHFGFEEELPESLVIRWPSGAVQVEKNLPVNALVTIVEDSTLTGVGEDVPSGKIPAAYSLSQNYPNPFNPQTTIVLDVPDRGEKVSVQVRVYDVRGRLVNTLVEEELEPGRHRVTWDGRDDAGSSVGSGIYICSMKAGDFTARRKLVLLR